MSKGQRGNKEPKKQKKAAPPVKAIPPGGPAVATVAPSPTKK